MGAGSRGLCLIDPLSTKRCQPGILMHVHPVLLRIAVGSQLQLPRPGPDGQPTESSQLAKQRDKITLTVERGEDGKLRATCSTWEQCGLCFLRVDLSLSSSWINPCPQLEAYRREVRAAELVLASAP